MQRILVGTLLASVIALSLGACSTDDGWGDARGAPQLADCAQLTSCESCTPIVGCGWCSNGQGQGACASGPDQCGTTTFTWSWDATGCRASADASTVGVDADQMGDARAAGDGSLGDAGFATDAGDSAR